MVHHNPMNSGPRVLLFVGFAALLLSACATPTSSSAAVDAASFDDDVAVVDIDAVETEATDVSDGDIGLADSGDTTDDGGGVEDDGDSLDTCDGKQREGCPCTQGDPECCFYNSNSAGLVCSPKEYCEKWMTKEQCDSLPYAWTSISDCGCWEFGPRSAWPDDCYLTFNWCKE